MDNQTENLWLSNLVRGEKGTGLFALLANQLADFGSTDWKIDIDTDVYGGLVKVLVQDIDYLECVRRGSNAIAFRWIPKDIADFNVLKAEITQCTRLCVHRCPRPGCLCIGGECT